MGRGTEASKALEEEDILKDDISESLFFLKVFRDFSFFFGGGGFCWQIF